MSDLVESYGSPTRSYTNSAGFQHIFESEQEEIDAWISHGGDVEKLNFELNFPVISNRVDSILQLAGKNWRTNSLVSSLECKVVAFPFGYEAKYLKLESTNSSVSAYIKEPSVSGSKQILEVCLITPAKIQRDAEHPLKHIEEYNQKDRLVYGFLINSNSYLEAFFEFWSDHSKPIDRKDLNYPEIINAAYDIFEDFYNPKDLRRIADPQWGDSAYKSNGYIIVQNSLVINQCGSFDDEGFPKDETNTLELEIQNFRPTLNLPESRIVYLSPKYQKQLSEFMGKEYVPATTKNLMDPAFAVNESRKRQQYINQYARIYHGHWGNYWHFISHPEVTSISFNQDLTKAVVDFRIIHQGGSACYELTAGKWNLKSSGLSWIE
jgi:hypothetical protein